MATQRERLQRTEALSLSDPEREAAIAALQARRAARGAADPLNRLRAYSAGAIEAGAEPITERTEADQGAPHISERVRETLLSLGFNAASECGPYVRKVDGVADAGTVSDGRRVVRLRMDESGRWFEALDGWGKVERDCDLRNFTDPGDAIRHLVPALAPELDAQAPKPFVVHVHGQPVTLTAETIAATREWFADNGRKCIAEAREYVESGGTRGHRVNDLESYVAWRMEGIGQSLAGKGDGSLAFIQRAVALQTGDCVALLR